MPNNINDESSYSGSVLKLIGILEKEASLFETFLDLLEKQQRALVRNDINELNRITDLQREKAVESKLLSKKRDVLVEELASEVDLDGNLTISRLIDFVSSEQAMVLGQIRETIVDLNGKIVRTSSQNKMLIDRSRDNIMKTMELLGSINVSGDHYQSGGQKSKTTRSIVLDRRA